jgi:phosphate starvation-inducible PhoH-like protein
MLMNDEYDNLILTRPAIEVGAGMGFLPGTIEEKYEPYLMPFRATLNERLGKSFADYMIKTRRIEPLPLAYMRGMSFKRSIILLDEAQNCTQREMKMFLTRIGEDCKVIVDGDSAQSDIDDSGLEDAILRCSHIPAVKTVRFSRDDVVRSGLCSEIVMAYDEPAPLTSYGMA